MRRDRHGAPTFVGWMLIGAAGALGVLTPFTIGSWLLVAVAVASIALALTVGGGPELTGLVAGAGVVPLYVAWLNRSGPGTICTPLDGGESCVDEWSPWPWLVVGLGLVVAGVLVYRSLRARHVASVTLG
jgi:hypothetical protein